ncbi:GerAB/ArcD/ProY family transporter [Sulfobacillus harzensis]|uniref:GerAB/ArcD/ProY family transporter n=1 Tax=Sulfobacillus harzensis TaxID=2729629 RepID=A0A7Y0L698_9FIRM|nr:GerAB/ArcD/ProY family transporter [Sulfobacillus harzensis]NMP23220.1 GerAB/ArcD/ProY family transporter [Sulfobacillus harzensis]
MRETTQHISPLQYAIIETTAFMGIGIFEFPRHLVLDSGNNAWWGFLVDWFMAYVGAWLLLKVAAVNPRETLLGMTRNIWPGISYWIFGMVDTIVHLVLPIIALTQFSFVIITFFLPDTPSWMIEAVMMGMATFITWWEFPPLARTIQVVYIPVMVLSALLLALLLPHVSQGYALAPSLDLRLLPIFKGAFRTFYIFVGYEAIPIFWPYIRAQDQPRARLCTYGALTVPGMFYALIIAETLGTEGPWYLVHLEWPGVSALRLISVTGLLIDKLGLLIVVFWGILSLFFISIRLWAITHVILPMMRRRTVLWYHAVLTSLAVLIFFLSQTIPNIHGTEQLTALAMPVLLVVIIIYPIIFILTAHIKKRNRHPQETHA